jgi:TrmH family RNA methyltransferase
MPHLFRFQESSSHPLKYYRKLATRKGRLEAGAFVVEGERAVRQVVESHPNAVLEIVSIEDTPSPYPRYPHRAVTGRQFRHISSSKTPQGVLAVVSLPMETYSDRLPVGDRVLLLEDIQDPGNVGSLIRTAAAFNFTGVILTEKSADPFSPKCVQSTAGSVLSLWLRRKKDYPEMVKELKEQGYFLLAADLDGNEDTTVLAGRPKLVLALGNEASGLTDEVLKMADYRLRLPTVREKAESLNVAACGAILMYLSADL